MTKPDRKKYIGGTDAKRILDGDWHQLWLEKTGRVEPEDLSGVFRVQLGIATEKFHGQWLTDWVEGFDLENGKFLSHVAHPWMCASLDWWNLVDDLPLDTKHSNHMADPDHVLEWYLPQAAHYCMVANRPKIWFSVIRGNNDPFQTLVEPAPDYMQALFQLEAQFWQHIATDTEPLDVPDQKLADAQVLGEKTKIDDMRVVDMTGNNQWAAAAEDYIVLEESAKTFEASKKTLKGLVDKDVRLAHGHGIQIKRASNGTLRFGKEK